MQQQHLYILNVRMYFVHLMYILNVRNLQNHYIGVLYAVA